MGSSLGTVLGSKAGEPAATAWYCLAVAATIFLMRSMFALIDLAMDPEREDAGEECRRLLKAEAPMLRLSAGDINRLRQWYNSLTDTNPAYLEPEDRDLYEQLLAALGRKS